MPISDEPLMQVIQKLNRLTKEVERLKTLRQAAGGGGGGAESFTDLDDTPADYSGAAGKFARVNDSETALEFGDPDPGVESFTDLDDTPASYVGQGGRFVRVSGNENALEFSEQPPGVESFTDLSDAPSSYTGAAGQLVRVNDDEDALEFAPLLTTGIWTPVITGSVSNPVVSYGARQANYVKIDKSVFFSLRVVVNSISGGSGSLRISLPLQVGAVSAQAVCEMANVILPTGTVLVTFNSVQNQSFGAFDVTKSTAAFEVLQVSAVGSGADIRVTGQYNAAS